MKMEDVVKCPFCRNEMALRTLVYTKSVYAYWCYRCRFEGAACKTQRAAKQAIERIQLRRAR